MITWTPYDLHLTRFSFKRNVPMTSTDYTSIYFPDVQFTPQDASVNREGLLTPEQERLIESIYRGRQRGAMQTVKWLLIFFVPLMLIGTISELTRTENPTAPQFVLIPFALLAVLLAISGGVTWYSGRFARARRIRHIEGVVEPVMREARIRASTYMRYELLVSRGWGRRKRFRLGNQPSLNHFPHGQRMRVYYLPYYPFDVILSAEQV